MNALEQAKANRDTAWAAYQQARAPFRRGMATTLAAYDQARDAWWEAEEALDKAKALYGKKMQHSAG